MGSSSSLLCCAEVLLKDLVTPSMTVGLTHPSDEQAGRLKRRDASITVTRQRDSLAQFVDGPSSQLGNSPLSVAELQQAMRSLSRLHESRVSSSKVHPDPNTGGPPRHHGYDLGSSRTAMTLEEGWCSIM